MPNRADEEKYLEEAVRLAWKGRGHTRPNPAVGAVIVRDGQIVGRGWHKRAGGDHAEVAAIKDAARRGQSIEGAAIYVTLEPCSRPGRVGACTDAIRAAGLRTVVYGSADPNPVNRGRAKRVLSRAGIDCRRTASPRLRELCDGLIRDFAKHIATGLPYVTVKLAMSLDGRICDDGGGARWISSAGARKATGRMREWVDAIMVGAETVRKDDPSLLSHGKRNDDLVRVVVTGSGRLPEKAQVFADGRNPTLVCRIDRSRPPREALREMLAGLGRRGIMHVLCEGGLELARSLADAGLVDEWISVIAPCVVGHRPVAEKILFVPAGGTEGFRLRGTEDVLLAYRRGGKTKGE